MKNSIFRGCALLFGFTMAVNAADVTWTGAEDDKWDNANNWSLFALPSFVDTAIINAHAPYDAIVLSGTTTSVSRIRLSTSAGNTTGLVVKDNALLSVSPGLYIGDYGTAALTVTESTVVFRGTDEIVLGNTVAADGTLHLQNAAITNLYKLSVGYKGTGTVNMTGGTLKVTDSPVGNSRQFYVGDTATASETFNMHGGEFTAYNAYIGNSGHGYFECTNATVTIQNLMNIGSEATGRGVLRAVDTRINVAKGRSITVGAKGDGEFRLAGSSAIPERGSSGSTPTLTIQSTAGARGLLRGWGELKDWSRIHNNGRVVADGEGLDRDLEFSLYHSTGNAYVTNTIDNVSSNGWYAVNKGRLVFPTRTVALSEIDNGTFAFSGGESEQDKDIDLVNSFRISLHGVGAGSLAASILASDRTLRNNAGAPMPTLPENLIGLWDVSYSTNFESVDFECRYDDTLVPKGRIVILKRFNPQTGDWQTLSTYETGTDNAPHRVKTDGLLPQNTDLRIGLIGAFASQSGTMTILN